MPDFSVDAHDLSDLARNLRRSAEHARREVDVTLAAIGAEHAAVAKLVVGEHSKSIPPTIRVEAMPGMARVTAGGDSPLAVLYEKGNRKGKGHDSRRKATGGGGLVFKHPVFGQKDVWVEQARFPFFSVARRRLRKKSHQQLADAWKAALRRSGIKVD